MLTKQAAWAVNLTILCALSGFAAAQDAGTHSEFVSTPPFEPGSEGSEAILKAEWSYQQQAGSLRYYGQIYTHPESDIAKGQCQGLDGGCEFIYIPIQ